MRMFISLRQLGFSVDQVRSTDECTSACRFLKDMENTESQHVAELDVYGDTPAAPHRFSDRVIGDMLLNI